MNEITKSLLGMVSNWTGSFKGAYNIRENGSCVGRMSSEHIRIESKTDKPGSVSYTHLTLPTTSRV